MVDTSSSQAAKREGRTEREMYMLRKARMWSERASWEPDWRDLVDYVAPYLGRFTASEANRGDKVSRSNKLLSTHARRSLKTLAAGLMGGMTSPARPWFRLGLPPNHQLHENQEVKRWLQQTTDIMRDIFARSNVYRALHQAYTELGAFGTSATVLVPDFQNVVHCHPLTVGEYALAADNRGIIDTLARDFNMTVGQMIQQFGLENCSTSVRSHYDRGNVDQWINVQHVIEPRRGRDTTKRDARNMRWRSVYYEAGRSDTRELLDDGGYQRFNVLAARWDVNGNDVYGTGPGHDALQDIKELQFSKSRRNQAIDYQTNPPLQAPSSLQKEGMNRFPGGISWVSNPGADNAVRTLFEVKLDLQQLMAVTQELVDLIKSHFYEDLFLMLANDTRSGITATEVAERHEEKLLMLGPVLERLHNELLNPLIDFTFERMTEVGILPRPPEVLQGVDIQVTYISTLAQAQRAVGLQAFDRVIATVGALAGSSQDMSVWDKINKDQVIDEYADGLGVTPSIIRSDDEVAALRAERAQQAQQAQALAAASQAAAAAKDASQVDPQTLGDTLGMFTQGYGGAQPPGGI